MKLRSLIIFLMVLLSLMALYYLNKLVLKLLRPRDSALRFWLYLLAGPALAFLYTYLLFRIIFRLFPLPVK